MFIGYSDIKMFMDGLSDFMAVKHRLMYIITTIFFFFISIMNYK